MLWFNRRWCSPKCILLGTFILGFFVVFKHFQQPSDDPNRLSPRHFAQHRSNQPSAADDHQPQIPTANASHYERLIVAALTKQRHGLGNNGEAVQLSGISQEIGDKQLAKIALNEELSQILAYNRTIPDVRSPLCADIKYDLDTLPTASIVIIFFNEPYSVLLRTVYSALGTGDPRILKEVILVDDFSTNEELGGQLDYYVRTRMPSNVKIIRLPKR